MKKNLWLVALVLACKSMSALPIGNPADASLLTEGVIWNSCFCDSCYPLCDKWSVRGGFYGAYVFQKPMRVDTKNNDSTIRKTRINTNAAFLALNFDNFIDVFATLGTSNGYVNSWSSSFGGTTSDATQGNLAVEVVSRTGFSYSLGSRVTLLEWCNWTIGIEGQYFSMSPKLNFIKGEKRRPSYPTGDTFWGYNEWQVGLGVAYSICLNECGTMLVPYGAVKYGRSFLDTNNAEGIVRQINSDIPVTIFDLKNIKDWGYGLGITLTAWSMGSITVEGRFVDETSINVIGQLRF